MSIPDPVAYAALTTTGDEASARALEAALEQLEPAPTGVGVFEIEDGSGLWEVGAYFSDPPDEIALALAAAMTGSAGFAVSPVGPKDWVAEVRRELTPVRAGRFLIHGGHDRAAAASARHPLEIEAAMAFGTGHHGTTRGCLLALDRLARQGARPRRVADIGCGTGVLAMAAAALWRMPVAASDIDPVAVDTAQANFQANRLAGRGMLVCAAGFKSDTLRAAGPFDLIFANILARPLRRLAPDMAAHVAPGGRLVLSGILNEQAAGVEAVYRAWGFARLFRLIDGDWTTLALRRPA